MEVALAAQKYVDYCRADIRFHEVALNHCCNRYLQNSFTTVGSRIAALRMYLFIPNATDEAITLTNHKELAANFKSGDVAKLEENLRRHVLAARELYLRLLSSYLPA